MEKIESDIQGVNRNYEALNKNLTELKELKYLLQKIDKFFEEVLLPMGVARIFFRGGGNTFKKNMQKIFKKFSEICKKIFKIFLKIFKKFVKKIAKNGFLSIFFKKFNKPSIQFLRVRTKNAICWKFVRKFS